MLQIKKLSISLKKDLRTIVEGLSFVLDAGDKAVIVGEEGNGKSTILKLIFEPSLVESYAEYSGEIVARSARFGYLSQEISSEDKKLTVFEYLSGRPLFYDATPRDLASVCSRLGLAGDFCFSDQIIGTLSGGERVKLQLAGILIEDPDILLLDEPSNDIDISTLEWLESFISGCQIPVLFVSHDETLIENTANIVIHIEQLRRKTLPRCTVARMPYAEYIQLRASKYEHQTMLARKEKSELDAKIERLGRIQQKVEHRQNTITRADAHGGQLLKKKMKSVKALEHRLAREAEEMTQLPDTEVAIFMKFDSDVSFPNGKTVIDFDVSELKTGERVLARDVRLTVVGPEKVCIIGKNGIGKTTFLKMLANELLSRSDIKCGYMPQNYEELLDFGRTPVDFLAKSDEKAERTKIRTFLGSVKYTADEMEHTIGELSGGQKAKLMFLKMILDGCNVLVLDEPTRNFSPMSNPVIRDILKAYGGAVISVSHDRKFISEVCEKVYTLSEKGLERSYL